MQKSLTPLHVIKDDDIRSNIKRTGVAATTISLLPSGNVAMPFIPLRSFVRTVPAPLHSLIVLRRFSRRPAMPAVLPGRGAGGCSMAALAALRCYPMGSFGYRLKGLIDLAKDQHSLRGFQASTVALVGQGDCAEKGSQKKRRKILPLTPHENIYNLPNILTFSRLLASPVIGYLVLHDQPATALGLFAVAGFTDLIDGFIARRWNLQTVVGSVIDPMADKILMTILTVTLAMQGLLPVWLAVIILGRDVGLGISAIYFRWISLPPPKTVARYWDFSLPSAEVHPTTISKLNTTLQLGLIGACMAHPLMTVSADLEIALQAMQYTVATTTVWSGLSYVYSKDAVKILKQSIEVKKDEKENV